MFDKTHKVQLTSAIIQGILGNPNLTQGEIFWDAIIEDAVNAAQKALILINESK